MNRTIKLSILAALVIVLHPQRSVAGSALNFNTNWAYHLGEASGAERWSFPMRAGCL